MKLLHLFKSRHVAFLFKNDGTSGLQKNIGSRSMSLPAGEPEKSILMKWKKYWEDLIKDYSDVLKDTVDDAKKHPSKTVLLCSLLGFSYICCKTNPDYINYREIIVKSKNDVLLVDKAIRNPKTDQFLTSIESCYNFGVLRRLSFGVFSVIWIDDNSNESGIYKTTCKYLKPQYLSYFDRIVDVGFLGKWWRHKSIMEDYDVNSDEWIVKDIKL